MQHSIFAKPAKFAKFYTTRKYVALQYLSTVTDGDIDVLLATINKSIGSHVTYTCTPLYNYDGFARNILKVPEDQVFKQERELQPKFHLTIDIEQRGTIPAI